MRYIRDVESIILIPFKRDLRFFSVSFHSKFVEVYIYICADNYFTIKSFDVVIAKIKSMRFLASLHIVFVLY